MLRYDSNERFFQNNSNYSTFAAGKSWHKCFYQFWNLSSGIFFGVTRFHFERCFERLSDFRLQMLLNKSWKISKQTIMATDEENKIISWAQFLVICEENDLFSKCQKDEIPRRAVTEKVNKVGNRQITEMVMRREPTA